MRKYMRFLLLSVLALCSLSMSAKYTQANFAKSSRLASGKWVKIAVDKTGVYEISYEALRNMGFSNPRNVNVYGRGGRQLGSNFQGPTGVPEYFDDIAQVPVMYANDTEKLYFFGLGTEEFNFQINANTYDSGASLNRTSKNIYSEKGYYFLSDSGDTMPMNKVNSTGLESLTEMTTGLGYSYHEKDLYHNTTNTGQLFYGEKLTPENPRISFPVEFPDAVPGAIGSVECVMYTDKIKNLNCLYGFEEGEGELVRTKDPAVTSTDFYPHSPYLSAMAIPGEKSTFIAEIDFSGNGGDPMDASNLDYWLISYCRKIPSLVAPDGSSMASDYIAFPRIGRGYTRKIRVPNGINRVVWDISDAASPFIIDLTYDGIDGMAKVSNTTATPQLAIFNPSMPQLQISDIRLDACEIQNQDIHAQAVNGADLIVVCIPQLKEAAERLADLHRVKLNQRVIVATTDECYNEFSGGVPDPMAYRALVKMASTSAYGCKNILLMGPLYADFRGITLDKNPTEGVIAYQSPTTNIERGGFNVNDYYGLMVDYIGYNTIESQRIEVGVGILPVRHPAELENYISKLERYLDRTDHAYYLNRFLSIGGVGDADLHTSQVPEVDKYITNLNKRTVINTQLAIDAYGYNEAHDKLFRMLDEGVSFITYYGHGNPNILNLKGYFFTSPDIMKFRNDVTPIWGFAGCELSEPDKGIRGIGESMVTATKYGMIGTVLASRLTWSSMNLDFFKKFSACFLRDGGQASSPTYRNPITIGQIFANTKSFSSYVNELAYQLVCDPAVVIPTINRYIEIKGDLPVAREGEFIEFKGHINNYDESGIEKDFNGEVVVRLMEPAKDIPCPHVVLNAQHDELPKEDVKINYADNQVSIGVAEVKDGEFSIRMMVPQGTGKFNGQTGRLHLCAYNPDNRMGAAGMTQIYYEAAAPGKESTLSADSEAPSIEVLEYDMEANTLHIRVSDNLALAYDNHPLKTPFRLIIDGKEYRQGASLNPVIDHKSVAYEKSVILHGLQEGSHSAKVMVRDAAGNDSSAEIVFDYLPNYARYAIALEQKVVDSEGKFFAVSEIPEKADLIILSPEGNIIHRAEFRNGNYNWDACDGSGNRVAPGLYKAYIIETSDHQRKGHSAMINVPVI